MNTGGPKKRPYYNWFASDFLGSSFVQSLTLIEECCYRRLLDIQATSSDRRLSNDPDELRNQCKNLPASQWTKIWARLKRKFEPHPDGHDGLVNLRLFEILAEQDAYLAERSASGKKGAEIKKQKNSTALSLASSSAISSGTSKPGSKTQASTSISTSKEESPLENKKHLSESLVPKNPSGSERASKNDPNDPEFRKQMWAPIEQSLRDNVESSSFVKFYEGIEIKAFTGSTVLLAVPKALIERNGGSCEQTAQLLTQHIQSQKFELLKGRRLIVSVLEAVEA